MQRNLFFIIALFSVMMMSCSDQIILSEKQESEISDKSYLELASESNTLANLIESSISSKSRSGEDSYPDYFGGVYIDSNGFLVVLSKGNIKATQSNINSISESKLIRFIPCEYSYQELLDVMNSLNGIFSSTQNEYTQNVTGYAILTEENVVEVALENYSPQTIADFRQNILDSPCLVFVKGKKVVVHASFGPGTMSILKSKGKYYTGSYAFRVKKDKLTGLVTSGHVASVGDTVMSGATDAEMIGKCTVSKISGSIDAAFVSITSSDQLLINTIGDTKNELSTETLNPKVGFPVVLCGQHCLSGSTGTIKSINASATVEGVNLTNLSRASYTSTKGDSGGVVYGTDGGKNKAVGVNIGENETSSGTYVLYCKASLVLSSLGVSRY